jgi:hypothetical protein
MKQVAGIQDEGATTPASGKIEAMSDTLDSQLHPCALAPNP